MAHAVRPRLALVVICLGTLIAPLDSAVNVAFPLITSAFDLQLSDIQWVVIAYVAAQACMTVVFGRLGDLYGHRRMFAVAMAGCAAAHAAIGFAPTYHSLIALRIVQGAAVGAAIACGPALATLLFEPAAKRRVLGVYVTTLSLGGAMGPIAGGALIEWLGWPGVFWVRAPIALLVLALLALVPDARAPRVPARMTHAPPAMPSALVRLEAFRSPAFSALQFASIAINLTCFSIMLLVPYVLIARAELSIAAGGIVLAMFPTGAFIGALAVARVSHALASVSLVRVSLFIAAFGLMLTAALVTSASAPALAGALALTGIGLGIFQVSHFDITTSLLPPGERGVAASIANLTRLAGVMLGAAAGSALYDLLGDFRMTIGTLAVVLLAVAACAAIVGRGARVRRAR